MKKIFNAILLFSLLYSTHLCAQESKLSIALSRYINNASHNPTRSAENMPVLVKGDIAKIRNYVISHGGVFKYSVANKFASIILPVSAINDFAQSAFVKRVEGIYNPGRPMDSVGCHQSYVFPVQNDSAPLTRGYLGDSVIVGIIDAGGFDFNHRDFKQPYDSTKTRFLYIWDQTSTGNSPPEFGYGTEWDSAEINKKECTEVDDDNHGTNCLGNAAGNGLAFSPSKAYIGVAPHANIIGVKFYNSPQYWESYVVDAANYIYSKADSLHEPCVINLSFGTYQGSHDGQDMATQMLDSLITEHSGHAFVAACGDGGPGSYFPFHLGYTATSDSLFTWFGPITGHPEAFEFWIDTNQANNFNFAVGVDNPAKWQYLGRDQFLNITEFLQAHANAYAGEVKNSKGQIIFYDTLIVEQVANAYHFVYYIGTDSLSYFYRFITKGSGHFDMWCDDSLTGNWQMGSHAYQYLFPTVNTFPDFARYVYPDSLQSICSDFQCSPNVISVANYSNRIDYVECSGPPYNSGINTGTLSATSSWGPTRDGRVDPDISAPGDMTVSPGDSVLLSELESSPDSYKVAIGCKYNRNGGTSLAAPFVAGVAALYLQQFTSATSEEVKAAIDSCAYKDSFTGAVPISYEWGYGKVDAYCIMQHDTLTGIEMPVPNKISLTNYPNPFNDYTNIVYSLGNIGFQSAEIDVYDMIGQKISVMPLHNSSGSLQFNNNNLPQGMYIYRLVVDQQPLAIGKFIILY